MRKRRGVVSIAEALMIGVISTLLIMAAFAFYTGYSRYLHPHVKPKLISVALCGKVLEIKNIGRYDITIDRIYTVVHYTRGTKKGAYVEDIGGGFSLAPGESYKINLDIPYNIVYISVEGEITRPVLNACNSTVIVVPPGVR